MSEETAYARGYSQGRGEMCREIVRILDEVAIELGDNAAVHRELVDAVDVGLIAHRAVAADRIIRLVGDEVQLFQLEQQLDG